MEKYWFTIWSILNNIMFSQVKTYLKNIYFNILLKNNSDHLNSVLDMQFSKLDEEVLYSIGADK